MIRIGITGGIGSGKSTVCKIFKSLGIPVFDADMVAKSLYSHDPGLKEEMIRLFGQSIYINDSINKVKLAGIIFKEPDKLRMVNQLVHPRVENEFEKFLQQNKHFLYSIYESAIIFETNSEKKFNRVILVHSPLDIRIQRVMNRDGVDRQAVVQRMRNQLDDDRILEKADWVIYNDEDHLLIPQVLEIHDKVRM